MIDNEATSTMERTSRKRSYRSTCKKIHCTNILEKKVDIENRMKELYTSQEEINNIDLSLLSIFTELT